MAGFRPSEKSLWCGLTRTAPFRVGLPAFFLYLSCLNVRLCGIGMYYGIEVFKCKWPRCYSVLGNDLRRSGQANAVRTRCARRKASLHLRHIRKKAGVFLHCRVRLTEKADGAKASCNCGQEADFLDSPLFVFHRGMDIKPQRRLNVRMAQHFRKALNVYAALNTA